MAAGQIGSCWASGSWSATAWTANTWQNAVVPVHPAGGPTTVNTVASLGNLFTKTVYGVPGRPVSTAIFGPSVADRVNRKQREQAKAAAEQARFLLSAALWLDDQED